MVKLCPSVPEHLLAYVGCFANLPDDVRELPATFNKINVPDFPKHINELPEKAYYNNLYWVDYFHPNQVRVCLPDDIIPLNKCALFRWYDEFASGELAGMVLADVAVGRPIIDVSSSS